MANGISTFCSNYFWSDSRVEGFGFEIEVVSAGDQFTMYDVARNIIGNCEVIQNKVAQLFMQINIYKVYFAHFF